MRRAIRHFVCLAILPAAAAVAQGPALVILNKGEATASLVSLADGRTIATMPVGDGPHEVAVSPDGRWAVAANYGGQTPGHSLTLLDLGTRSTVKTIELGQYRRPHGIAWLPDGRRVVVTSELGEAVLVVNVAAGAIDQVIKTNVAGTHLLTLSKDGHRVWTSNIGSGTNSLIDLEKGAVVKTAPNGKGPEAIDISPDGRELWTADRPLNRVTVLDANTLDSIAAWPTGQFPNRLHFTPDGRWVLQSNAQSSTVSIFDARTRKLAGTIDFPYDEKLAKPTMLAQMGRSASPLGILIAPDGKRAWVALAAMDRIAEVDIATRKIVRHIVAGREPDGMAWVPSTATTAPRVPYFPPAGEWARRSAASVGLDSLGIAGAVAFARANEIGWSMSMAEQMPRNFPKEPFPAVVGPIKDRGVQSGIIIRHGYVVAEWGDTGRVDMTFSVAKSYVSTVAGLAFDRGLIKDLDAPVRDLVHDGGYDSPHNAPITWRMHLNQTSEWEGELFGKPDAADRRNGYTRSLEPPGTVWEYNDVRVNRTALSLLRVLGEPLPQVLKRGIMDPIGASNRWEWHGYRTSTVDVDGKPVESVSGGGHWGGGLWATTRDHARFGELMLNRGAWNGRRLLSERWVDLATTPAPLKPVYGFMWWLNTDRQQYPAATPRSFFALGAGGNVIWVCPELDLVAVVRWLDTRAVNEFMRRVVAAAAVD